MAEEYDLSHGRVVRIVGKVTAHGLPTLRYVRSSSGSYLTAAGLRCWQRLGLPFVEALLVDYPLPGERLTITAHTNGTIVLQAVSSQDAYRELDYIDPRTDFVYRSAEITSARHRQYTVIDHLAVLRRAAPSIATPTCRRWAFAPRDVRQR